LFGGHFGVRVFSPQNSSPIARALRGVDATTRSSIHAFARLKNQQFVPSSSPNPQNKRYIFNSCLRLPDARSGYYLFQNGTSNQLVPNHTLCIGRVPRFGFERPG
jgi:hypothetical protein